MRYWEGPVWEGPVTVSVSHLRRGYLEMTGYGNWARVRTPNPALNIDWPREFPAALAGHKYLNLRVFEA